MNQLPINTLKSEVNAAVNELLSLQPYGNPRRPTYATHLRELGMRLKTALENHDAASLLRPDVAEFAAKMSAMMQEKETIKGQVDEKKRADALMMLDYQCNRLKNEQYLFHPSNKDELRRVLIHIANFSMLAESRV
jgi:hypothetical protein